MLKKILAVTLCITILFTAQLGQVNKAYAMPFAIPAGAGVFALGAIALGGVVAWAGLESFGDDISDFGNKLWASTSTATKNAVNSVVSWVKKDTAGTTIPDLKIDYGALSADVKATLQARSQAAFVSTVGQVNTKNYESTAESVSMGKVSGAEVMSQYPMAKVTDTWYGKLWMDIVKDSHIFMIVGATGETYFAKSLEVIINDTGSTLMHSNGYKLSDPFTYNEYWIGNLTAGKSKWLQDVNVIRSFEQLRTQLYATFGATAYVVTTDYMHNMLQNAARKFLENWETMLDAGLVISGPAILEANPGITWDGTQFVDAVGNPVNTGQLNIPYPRVIDGKVAVPVGTGTWQDVTTGTTVGEGTGTIPGEGTGEGTGGILQGLWDWLKGILQAILDAIKALLGLLGIIALVEAIVGLFEDLIARWDAARSAPTKKVDFSKLKVAAAGLTTVFPFSIPWDFARLIGIFDVQPQTPKFDIDISKDVKVAGKTIPIKYDFTLDFSFFNPLAKAMRWILILIFDIAMILALRRLTPD